MDWTRATCTWEALREADPVSQPAYFSGRLVCTTGFSGGCWNCGQSAAFRVEPTQSPNATENLSHRGTAQPPRSPAPSLLLKSVNIPIPVRAEDVGCDGSFCVLTGLG